MISLTKAQRILETRVTSGAGFYAYFEDGDNIWFEPIVVFVTETGVAHDGEYLFEVTPITFHGMGWMPLEGNYPQFQRIVTEAEAQEIREKDPRWPLFEKSEVPIVVAPEPIIPLQEKTTRVVNWEGIDAIGQKVRIKGDAEHGFEIEVYLEDGDVWQAPADSHGYRWIIEAFLAEVLETPLFLPGVKDREDTDRLNAVYRERNALVSALSKLFPSFLARHDGEDWEDDWRNLVVVHLPAGQATWHIHDSELAMFAHLQLDPDFVWDGHTTAEKYERLAALAVGG